MNKFDNDIYLTDIQNKTINFMKNGKSYRLEINLEFNAITLYQIFESDDDFEIYSIKL